VIREQRQQQQRVRGSWLGDRETGDLGRFRFGGQFGAPLPEIAVAQPPRTGTTSQPSWRPRGRRDDEEGDDDDEVDARSAWAANSRGGGRVPASTSSRYAPSSSSRAPSTAMSIIDRFRML
jgi:hypothetical protein